MLKPCGDELIGGRYRLGRELARGGMGAVWSGRDIKLRRPVAVKLLDARLRSNSAQRARFEREAMAVAKLQSPHVVQVFDYGIERGWPFIVMELLEGEDLRGRLRRRRCLSLEAMGNIVVQTAKALSAAHAAGIVHRDLKPANVFLARGDEDEIVKILDFGVAKTLNTEGFEDEQTQDGAILGTPQFMAPEQARGLPGELDHRADLWSLGVIVYRALTGKLPFPGKSPADVIVKICTSPLQRASQLAPDLPKEIDDFFARALARKKEDRFHSARELALAFTRVAPASYASLTMPEPHPDIADILRRLNAEPPAPTDSLGGYRRTATPPPAIATTSNPATTAPGQTSLAASDLSELESDAFSDELPTLGEDPLATDRSTSDGQDTRVFHDLGDDSSSGDLTTLGASLAATGEARVADQPGADQPSDGDLSEPSLASMVEPSAPPPPRRSSTVRALAMAVAAALVGVLLATVGNVVDREDGPNTAAPRPAERSAPRTPANTAATAAAVSHDEQPLAPTSSAPTTPIPPTTVSPATSSPAADAPRTAAPAPIGAPQRSMDLRPPTSGAPAAAASSAASSSAASSSAASSSAGAPSSAERPSSVVPPSSGEREPPSDPFAERL